ncbi:MAG: acyl-CoA reductase [Candidatus Njordarchaeales archaeon]
MILKAFYLPPSLDDLEEDFEFRELEVDGYRILYPKISPEQMKRIAEAIKNAAKSIYENKDTEYLAEVIQKVRDLWMNPDYEKRKIALEILPKLTGLSKEVIIYYQFGTIRKMNKNVVKFLSNLKIDKKVLDKFILLEDANVWLRGYASFMNKLKFGKAIKNLRRPKLVTFITPSNVPGLIEAIGVLLSVCSRTGMIIKTPSKQPVFGPVFAESLREIDEELGETIAVLPWKGGDKNIEAVLFRESDAISVVGSTETVLSVKRRVDELRKRGYRIKGCYHGGKFGLSVVAKEYVRRDVAALSVIDGIGYEGYMCASPAFGFFVEDDGTGLARKFAKYMAEEAEWITKIIQQSDLFRKYREQELQKYLSLEAMGKIEVFLPENNGCAVIFDPEPKLVPDGQNRLLKVYPIKSIFDVVRTLKPWKEYLQTIGVAIPNEKLFEFADKVARLGVSNLRVVGTVTLPRLGESWDGNYPVLEFMLDEDYVHWISINAKDIDAELEKLSNNLEALREGKLISG